MPCQFCKSTTHTLTKCDSPIAHRYLVSFLLFHISRPFHISEQLTFLKKYSKPQLAIVCSQLKVPTTGNKDHLMFSIIHKMFKNRTASDMISTLSSENYFIINNQYLYLYQLGQPNYDGSLQSKLISMFEHFYMITYRVPRHGLPLSDYLLIVEQYNNSSGVNYYESWSHLKKLAIHVDVDNTLQNQECNICFEIKPNAKLGCLHEYCVDCIFGSAKVRTKSFINCAMCRAEINELQVASLEIKNELLQKISSI